MDPPAPRPFRRPVLHQALVAVASLLVPRHDRAAWRARQDRRLFEWWLLAERGEFPRPGAELAQLLREAFTHAWRQRVPAERFRKWWGSPLAVIELACGAAAILALATGGCAYTRGLIRLADVLLAQRADVRSDVLAAHAFMLAVGWAVGATTLVLRHPPMSFGRLSAWALYLFQCIAATALISVAWIEGGAAWRACFPLSEGTRVLGTLLLSALYPAALGSTLIWITKDQVRRCPVCLHRLEMPVSIGSWSSVFNPPATELLCAEGHGSLVLPDAEDIAGRQWIALDDSWRQLFRHTPA
ncbi:MAG: hypothetical protein HY821_02400 [Acidobacteria bacterium]|nr:hypothetical protein [Acidobacteriota bacterium]